MTNPLSPSYMDTKSTYYSPIRDPINTTTRNTSTIPVMSDYHTGVAEEEEDDDEIEEAGPSTVSQLSSSVSEETYKQLKRKMKEITEVLLGGYLDRYEQMLTSITVEHGNE